MSTAHIIGKYNATPPSLTDGQTVQLQVTTAGALKTDASGSSASITSVVPGTGATNLGKAEDAAHTSGDVGVQMLGVANEAQTNLSGADGDYTPVATNRKGNVYNQETMVDQFVDQTNQVAAMVIKPLAVSTYSPTLFTNFGANTTLNIKATPGNVFSFYVTNTNAAVRYFQLHNTATTPAGAAVPLRTYTLPALTGVLIIGTDVLTTAGVNFSTGIAFATSTTAGTYTAATAGDHYIEVNFK